MKTHLSPHLTLYEYLTTSHREYLDEQFNPPEWVLKNAQVFASTIFEPCRALLGPLVVTSGWRCPGLNAAVKGSPNSMHTWALAADVWPLMHSVATAMGILYRSQIRFHELIYERNRWIHVSAPHPGLPPDGRKLMTFDGARYERWDPTDPRVK